MTTTPTRPRDAASLILHREHGTEHLVLMGRRPRSARFMPGVYVFPGGAVEAEDKRVRPATRLHPHVTPLLRVGGSPARARALAVTAVRETYEETGLMLGRPGDVGSIGRPVWEAWRATGITPNLECLDVAGRAITPTRLAIRFHARFFFAHARHLSGAIGGDGELEDVHWVSTSETKHLPLADVQAFMLEHLVQLLDHGRRERARSLFTHRKNKRQVRYY